LSSSAGSDSPIPPPICHCSRARRALLPHPDRPITVSYNLPGVKRPEAGCAGHRDIFQAKITKWNTRRSRRKTPVSSCPAPRSIAHRFGLLGHHQNFSEFLGQGAPGVWKLGSDSTINWPPTAGAATPTAGGRRSSRPRGAIGYVDYADAKGLRADLGFDQEPSGNYIEPSVQSATEAASHASVKPD